MAFGLFSKKRKIDRAIKKTLNKLAQSPDRWAAMELLRDHGTDEALFTLCKRLAITSSKEIEDQQAKQWVVTTLVDKGPMVVGPLRRYMLSSTNIAYHLDILGKVTKGAETLAVIDEILADEEPGYTRDPVKRTQLFDWLAEWKGTSDSEILRRVKPYLTDFDENVRFSAAHCFEQHVCDEAAEPLVNALLREDEDSRRLQVRIAEILADHNLDLCGRKDEVSALTNDVLSDFRLKHNKLVRKGK